jgi:hypothetical protein
LSLTRADGAVFAQSMFSPQSAALIGGNDTLQCARIARTVFKIVAELDALPNFSALCDKLGGKGARYGQKKFWRTQ